MEQSLKTIVERLAYEGVPVAALTRAFQVDRDQMYGTLRAALESGRLSEIPPSEWPPTKGRVPRIGSGRVNQVDPETVLVLLMKTYDLTRQQALLMRAMLLRPQATREQLYEAAQLAHEHGEDTEPKIVQVVICKLRRRLAKRKHRVVIHTIWNGGYYIKRDQRMRIFEKIGVVGNVEPEGT